MKESYFFRESLLIVNQFFVIIYLFVMAVTGNLIGAENLVKFLLISLIFCDAAYISYRNVKGNHILTKFSYLFLLLGWQFLLSLFENNLISQNLSIFLLPICLYQSFYFIQVFVFQESGYCMQKGFLEICKITCILSIVGFLISKRLFAIGFQIQSVLSLVTFIVIGIVNRKRVCFFCKSQKQDLSFSLTIIGVFFVVYIVIFNSNIGYMDSIGSYFFVMLTFYSVHNIVFEYSTRQEKIFELKKIYVFFLVSVILTLLILTVYVFSISLMVVFVLFHIAVLLILLYNLMLYLQISKQPVFFKNVTEQQHFYDYTLAQIRREEDLRKDFSNYLHDDVLQDLLSIKNLVHKADKPDIQQLLYDTLGKLNTSIRTKMQVYHPTMPKTMTIKENIQILIDSLAENKNITVVFDCSDTFFLVEPYNFIFYRMIQELITNALKHSRASIIQVLLMQEKDMITLKVSDNGVGLKSEFVFTSEHRGLSSIYEQVSLLNGKMEVKSLSDFGTEISIIIPMRGEDSYESFISR